MKNIKIKFKEILPVIAVFLVIIVSVIYMINYFQILDKKYNEGKKKQESVAEISKVIEKVLVANMVLSDKEYEAEEKIEQITKDTSKSNEEKEKYKNNNTYKLIEEKNNKGVEELKYKVTSNIGKTTGEIITILNGLMSNNKFNFTMSDSNQTKETNADSDLKKLQ